MRIWLDEPRLKQQMSWLTKDRWAALPPLPALWIHVSENHGVTFQLYLVRLSSSIGTYIPYLGVPLPMLVRWARNADSLVRYTHDITDERLRKYIIACSKFGFVDQYQDSTIIIIRLGIVFSVRSLEAVQRRALVPHVYDLNPILYLLSPPRPSLTSSPYNRLKNHAWTDFVKLGVEHFPQNSYA